LGSSAGLLLLLLLRRRLVWIPRDWTWILRVARMPGYRYAMRVYAEYVRGTLAERPLQDMTDT